jgi:type II secretory pathway component GspD/PulD (secretin)
MVLAAALSCAAVAPRAQQALEIIPLRHRTVEQVLPVLQPLLEPGATLSGSRGQLFLRASPANVADVKRALEAIDRPLRRLQVSVRFDDALARERRGIEASGTIGSGGARVGITAEDARRTVSERVDQRLQVLEGGRAVIFTGQSRPLQVQGGAVIQEMASGFEVIPRLSGDLAVLEVQTSSMQGQRAATTLSARLGEWVEIGGSASTTAREARGIASASRSQAEESLRVWVKVEELPN